MQEAVAEGVGAMAALLKLPEGKLDEILLEAAQGEVVAPAGFNSPDQIVIAGQPGRGGTRDGTCEGRGRKAGEGVAGQRSVSLPADVRGTGSPAAGARFHRGSPTCEFR